METMLGIVEQEGVFIIVAVDKVVVSGTGVAVGGEILVDGSGAAVHPFRVVAEICACSTTPHTLDERSSWPRPAWLHSSPFQVDFYLGHWRILVLSPCAAWRRTWRRNDLTCEA